MTEEFESYILSAIFFIILCVFFYFWKIHRKRATETAQQKFIRETLELARAQFENFNLKPHLEGAPRNGLSALLQQLDNNGLHMLVSGYVPQEWKQKPIDVYFRARREEGPVFYAFNSTIKNIDSDYEHSQISLEIPQQMRVEKKRHFIRVQPHENDVRVIGVWALQPGKHLPRSTNDMGAPLTHYKHGMKNETVRLENISASGVALRFKLDKDGKPPMQFAKGSQLLCLIVYSHGADNDDTIAFWCTGEIMNSRIAEGQTRELVIGMEFTNWAVLEQGSGEIHWAHSSPSRGVKPILQWVERIDKKIPSK